MKNNDKNFYANFYETYIKYSCRQWLQRVFLYSELVKLAGNKIHMLEIGPGTGDVSALVGQSIVRSGGTLEYCSIDRLAEYSQAPNERLTFIGAHATSITREDAFTYSTVEALTKDIELKSGQTLDLVLCEHVLYGLLAKHGESDLAFAALQPYFDALSRNGLFVNVLSAKSDSDSLRIRSATVTAPIDVYRNLMRKHKVATFEIPIQAELVFPVIDSGSWDKLLSGDYDYQSESSVFQDAHDLITFFGSNMEKLRASAQLQDYLTRFRKLLEEKNGVMMLNVVVFVSTSSTSDEFLKKLARTISQAEDKLQSYTPAAPADLDTVRILPHLHS